MNGPDGLTKDDDVALVFRAMPFTAGGMMSGPGMARCVLRFVRWEDQGDTIVLREHSIEEEILWRFPVADVYFTKLPDGFIARQQQAQAQAAEEAATRMQLLGGGGGRRGPGPFSQ